MQGWTAIQGMESQEKEVNKVWRIQKICLESVNSKLKATKIIRQRRALYWQKIPESSSARRETVDIDIRITSRNGDRKIM